MHLCMMYVCIHMYACMYDVCVYKNACMYVYKWMHL
jgi:hypothetical protein